MYDLTCDTCGRSGTVDDGIEAGEPCVDECEGIVRFVDPLDTKIHQLDDEAFERCASSIGVALETGLGGHIIFQPGDATKYRIEIGRRNVLVISNGEKPYGYTKNIHSATISFGTDSNMTQTVWGDACVLEPRHPWTAAVWRRLYALTEGYLSDVSAGV